MGASSTSTPEHFSPQLNPSDNNPDSGIEQESVHIIIINDLKENLAKSTNAINDLEESIMTKDKIIKSLDAKLRTSESDRLSQKWRRK